MSTRPLVLTVDHNRRNLELLERYLTEGGFEVASASDLAEFDRLLEGKPDVRAALIDLAGLDRTIWERCERLRALGVPFLLISPQQTMAMRQASAAHGASGLLVKPLVIRELLGLLNTLIESQS